MKIAKITLDVGDGKLLQLTRSDVERLLAMFGEGKAPTTLPVRKVRVEQYVDGKPAKDKKGKPYIPTAQRKLGERLAKILPEAWPSLKRGERVTAATKEVEMSEGTFRRVLSGTAPVATSTLVAINQWATAKERALSSN